MSRIRLILLSLLAVLAFGAVAAASASAAHEFWVPECENQGPGHKYATRVKCEKGEIGTGEWERSGALAPIAAGEEVPVEGTSGTSILEVPELNEAKIECKEDKFSGTLKAAGQTTAKVEFEKCTVVSPEHCTVAEPIKVNVTDQLVIFHETLADAFEPPSGEPFVVIKLKGSECLAKGEFKVKGKQQCALPEGEIEKVEHEIDCKPIGSELTLGAKEAKFEGKEKVKLTGGGNWKAKE